MKKGVIYDMKDFPLPPWLAILLVIFLFIIGQWQLALINIILLIIQFIGSYFFNVSPKIALWVAAAICLGIWFLLCALGIMEFPERLG